MAKILNIKEFCKNLKEVTTSKVLDKKKFHPEGLFSEQIFGPLKNYTCQCDVYYGPNCSGTCSKCGVDIEKSTVRRSRFAKIVLPGEVINPMFYDLFIEVVPSDVKHKLDILKNDFKSILYKDPETKHYTVTSEKSEIPSGVQQWEKIEAIYELVRGTVEYHINNKEGDQDHWKIIQNNLDQLLIKEVIVLPPDLRPASKNLLRNNHRVDPINSFYGEILTKKETMIKTQKTPQDRKEIFYAYYKLLQKDVDNLYLKILEKLSKKEGLIRGNILGKRIDFSGRAVIVPDPTIELDECILPYKMVLELFKLSIAKKLLERGKFKLLNRAENYITECIESNNPSLFKICEKVVDGQVCLLNRQPSLHRLSMLGFKIKVSGDSVIKIHPLICPPFNADFDGDQMAVYVPVSEEAKQEILEKFLVTKNFTNPANGNLTTTPSQDIVLGIYMLSKNVFPELKEYVDCKGKSIPLSMKLINDCFPEDYEVINQIVDNKILISNLNFIKNNYHHEVTKSVLNKIKKLGFKYSTLYGCTMSLSSFKLRGSEVIKDNLYKSKNVNDQLNKVSSNETKEMLKENFKYSYMIESGARGSWDQARQIVLTRGFISNFKGQILPTPIKHSLLDGLTQKEFFNSTYGCRKGLLDVALNTGNSGYLSRKLIFACSNLMISDICEDCGTNDCLRVYVKSKEKARMLIGRYYKENNKLYKITEDNYKDIIKRTIELRSPIYCTSEKICHKCYGDLYKDLHSKYIGVIAAQSLGECNTQLVLRTFHLSLCFKTEIIDVNNNPIRIDDLYRRVNIDNEDIYTFSCSPEGKIEVSKILNVFNDHVNDKLVRITLYNDEIIEATPGHEFMLRNGEYIKCEDLKEGVSLMPINMYEGDYRQIKQNDTNRKGYVFHLSSEHLDSNTWNVNKEDCKVRHHCDFNRKNDSPKNIVTVEKEIHSKIHFMNDPKINKIFNITEEMIEEQRRKSSEAVSKSNVERMKNPIYRQSVIEKRVETWKNSKLREHVGKSVKEWYDNNPEEGKRVTMEARKTCAKNVIDKVKELNLELTDDSYMNVREKYFTVHHPLFSYVKENHPELVEDFIVIKKVIKSKEHLNSETRMDKVLAKMEQLNLEKTTTNFDKCNDTCYPNKQTQHSRKRLLSYSPNYLDHLLNDHVELIKKSKKQSEMESRMDIILNKMIDLSMEMTMNNFYKANEICYPNIYGRKKVESMLKYSPNYLDHLKLNHTVKKIEFITLDKPEKMYDIEVDSKHHNFPLKAGIFVHNSGVAQANNDSTDMRQQDIVADLSSVSKLLHHVKKRQCIEIVSDLFDIYNTSKQIYHVHFEAVVSQLMWVGNRKWRTIGYREGDDKNRNQVEPSFYSIQSVPSKESWLMGLAFSNPRKHIIRGILDSGNYSGIIDKILCGEKIE